MDYDIDLDMIDRETFLATDWEAHQEYGRNVGAMEPDRAWILTPWDAWVKNPSYHGPPVPHPEADDYEAEGEPVKNWSAYLDDEIPF